MDEKLFRILYVFSDLAAPLLAGYIAYQRGRISDALCNAIIRFNIIVMATLLAVLSFWVMPLSRSLLWLPLFSALFMLVPGVIAALTFARRHRDPLSRGAYYMSAMLTNIGTIAGLSAFILYNETGFAYVQIVSSFQVGLLESTVRIAVRSHLVPPITDCPDHLRRCLRKPPRAEKRRPRPVPRQHI